jgi:hypothetical protein
MLGIDHMKMKKIICCVICTLMLLTVGSAVGFSLQTERISTISSGIHSPPTPAYVSSPPQMTPTNGDKVPYHPDVTAVSLDDIVEGMLEQVDPSVFLSYEENLTANGPRPTGSANCIAAATYIHDQFQNMSLPVRYAYWSSSGYSSDNVEATINGTDETSDEIYIICAHYDTVSAGPGADDDTSGTVAVLMAASIMSQYQFNHTIKFVTFSGEEQGLLGSAVYASQAASQGWNIVGVLNCDMISYAITTSDGSNLIVFENTPSEWLYTYTFNINAEYSGYTQLTLHHGGSTWGSDHNSFWDEGYDALFYFEYTETPYYHTAQDTIAHINASYAVKNIKLVLATLAELAEASLKSNPPANPVITGTTTGVINELYTYAVVTTEPDGEDVYYFIDWGDGTNSGWFGPYASGQEATAQKSWSTAGTYTVRAKAKDIHQVSSGWSTPLMVTILLDRAPEIPTIDGPAKGRAGISYLYTFTTTDADGDLVYYMIDWGDNTTSGWLGPYNSGAIASVNHIWDKTGTYTIQAKAKDIHDVESDWATMSIKMPFDYSYTLHGFLQHLFERFPHLFPILRHQLGY